MNKVFYFILACCSGVAIAQDDPMPGNPGTVYDCVAIVTNEVVSTSGTITNGTGTFTGDYDCIRRTPSTGVGCVICVATQWRNGSVFGPPVAGTTTTQTIGLACNGSTALSKTNGPRNFTTLGITYPVFVVDVYLGSCNNPGLRIFYDNEALL